MDSRWTSRCDTTPQDANHNQLPGPPNFGQLSPAASSPYYPFPQALSVSSISPQALHWDSSAGPRAMPVRTRASKVTKPAPAGRRGTCQSSLPGTAQGHHLEQFVQQGINNVNSDAAQMSQLEVSGSNDHAESAANLTNAGAGVHGSTSIPGLQSSMHNAFDTRAFRLDEDHQLSRNTASPGHSSLDNNDVLVKSDTLTPAQTAADIILKMYPSAKVDGTLCKKLADEAARRDPVQRRRDQKLNVERRSNLEALFAHVTGDVAPQNNSNPQHPQQSQFTPTVQTPSFQPGGVMLNFQQQSMPPPNSPSVMASYHTDDGEWSMGDHTRNMINSVIRDTMMLSKKERYVARIEAAAKELGMRIAELQEYLQTPEGSVEQQRDQRYHMAQQGHIGDVSMDESSAGAPMS
ncbi:hypothetical protein E4U55_001472 [Claviceps digitariae]|nr:hypothetical protein E4U55_001472 [Claviceps digitariae]